MFCLKVIENRYITLFTRIFWMRNYGFSPEELSVLKKLDMPAKIQDFLDNDVKYNLEKGGERQYSPRLVLMHRKAQCFEGALFAAAALRVNGFPPLILDLRAKRDDDHVLAVYKIRNRWGAIGQSKFSGLGFREAVYSNIRELVMSYFEHYFNYGREKTLREFSMPVNLSRFDRKNWMLSEKPLEYIADYIDKVKHTKIALPPKLRPVNKRRLKFEQIVKK
ncbi:MAG: hypothetical protein ABID38_05320 [Candidatus Diapherotrites archaeon]